MGFNWKCPHCGKPVTMGEEDHKSHVYEVRVRTAKPGEHIALTYRVFKCPNPDCHQITLDVGACFGTWSFNHVQGCDRFDGKFRPDLTPSSPVGLGKVRFLPRVAVPLSAHAPAGVREDYDEACTIADLSPKAAATLCRRALQGMIRDFWGVAEKTLYAELEKIRERCDPELFTALTAIRSIGNIGAHPEVDVNLIVDVEEGEVQSLISVLQILDQEWYVTRAQRAARLSTVQSLGEAKAVARLANATVVPVPPDVS